MQSNRSDSSCPITRRVYSFTAASDLRGKHRVQAELKRLEQEAKSLEVSSRLNVFLATSYCCWFNR
uniref:Guanine nucleotide-binding protein subunit gamma 2 isoform X2 n=1 Tax=Rhizophora mucronata TaxID=61149 RepID=A0A2P2LZB8_RHIMU